MWVYQKAMGQCLMGYWKCRNIHHFLQKSCTALDGWNPNGLNNWSAGAGFRNQALTVADLWGFIRDFYMGDLWCSTIKRMESVGKSQPSCDGIWCSTNMRAWLVTGSVEAWWNQFVRDFTAMKNDHRVICGFWTIKHLETGKLYRSYGRILANHLYS